MPDPDSLNRNTPKNFGLLSVLGWVIAAAAVTIALTFLLFWRMTAEITEDARRMAASIAAGFDQAPAVHSSDQCRFHGHRRRKYPRARTRNPSKARTRSPSLEPQLALQHENTRDRSHFYSQSRSRSERSDSDQHRSTQPLCQCRPPSSETAFLGMGDVRVLQDEDGLWNKLTPEDREQAFRALKKKHAKLSPSRTCCPKPGSRLRSASAN